MCLQRLRARKWMNASNGHRVTCLCPASLFSKPAQCFMELHCTCPASTTLQSSCCLHGVKNRQAHSQRSSDALASRVLRYVNREVTSGSPKSGRCSSCSSVSSVAEVSPTNKSNPSRVATIFRACGRGVKGSSAHKTHVPPSNRTIDLIQQRALYKYESIGLYHAGFGLYHTPLAFHRRPRQGYVGDVLELDFQKLIAVVCPGVRNSPGK
jgi:hypothetical protein